MWSLVMGGRPRSWCSSASEIVCVGDLYRGGICRLCKMKLSISFYKRLCCSWWSAGNNNSGASSWLQLNLLWWLIRSRHSCNVQDPWKLLKSWSVLLCSSWLLAKCTLWWRSSSTSYVAACNSFNMQYLSIFIFSTFLNPSSCWSSWPINAYLVIVQSWISWLRPVAAATTTCRMLKSVDISDSAAKQLSRSELLVSCWSAVACPVDGAVTASSYKLEELIAWWCSTFCLTASVITGVESAGRWTTEEAYSSFSGVSGPTPWSWSYEGTCAGEAGFGSFWHADAAWISWLGLLRKGWDSYSTWGADATGTTVVAGCMFAILCVFLRR